MSDLAPFAEPWTDADAEYHGLRPATEGGSLFCGVTHQEYAVNGVTYQWPRSIVTLKWSMSFSRLGKLSDMDFKDCATAWLKEISDCCNRVYEYVANPRAANIVYGVKKLDGRNGVLALHDLPVGNVTPDTQLLCWFDDSEAWTISDTPQQGEIDVYTTGGHEAEHGEGLGHKPASVTAPARIAPIYDPRMRYLQEADKAELIRRNGPRIVVPSPNLPPSSPPGSKPVIIECENAKVYQPGSTLLWQGPIKIELPRVK